MKNNKNPVSGPIWALFVQIFKNENFAKNFSSVIFLSIMNPYLHVKNQKNLMSNFCEKLQTDKPIHEKIEMNPTHNEGKYVIRTLKNKFYKYMNLTLKNVKTLYHEHI